MLDNIVRYLERCDDTYYNTDNPIVSDSTYDAMVEMLRRLDPGNEYLRKVGAKVNSNKLGRVIPMGTLSKCHKEDEVLKWLNSEKGEILVSPKYDGFAVELFYVNGNLASASTRGDGYVGEDVLASMMRVKSVPISIPSDTSTVIVRGEVIIPRVNHDKIKSLGYTAMRNAVPGIVRSNRHDALGYVDFVAYEFIDGRVDRVGQRELYSKYFIVEDYHLLNYQDIDCINTIRDNLRESDYDYELDGIVLKTKIILEDDLINPSHMIAWKYKSNRESTILRGIEYQLGVTGYFTPIGIFDEVEFQGAKLTRASLGNISRMKREFNGMTIGSVVEVSRRGDIIPYIEELSYTETTGDLVEYPVRCPHCGELLYIDTEDEKWEPHCGNKSCPEILRLQITQFAKSIGIKGIGDKLVKGLIDSGHIKSILDIYTLDPVNILNLPRQGKSSVDKWLQLQEKRLTALELLTAYPFIDLGKKVWEVLLSKYPYRRLLCISREDLEKDNLKGIGSNKVESIVSQIETNYEELYALSEVHNLV